MDGPVRRERKPLLNFIEESNWIEGITTDDVYPDEQYQLYADFLAIEHVTIDDLAAFVSAIQPGAVLRDREGLNVRVGMHIPPLGGPAVPFKLKGLLHQVQVGLSAYEVHQVYEHLHPFTDGNGRSGRALWAWQMTRIGYRFQNRFLHEWYYQSLQNR